MSTYCFFDSLHISRKTEMVLLAFFSFAGVVLGVLIAYTLEPFFFSLMRMATSVHVSIVGLFLVALFPFLITAIAAYLSKPYLFFPVSFFKCFSYTLIMCSICIEFSFAGWLVCMLLMFSDTVAMLALYWYWIRNMHGFRDSGINDLLVSFLVSLIGCLADYFWVSPFLFTLMND